MEDTVIVDLYWARDEAAISQTEQKYGPYLTKIAYNILANIEDSRESVNDTYLGAWDSMPPHKPAALSAYLAKITRRISIDILRRRSSKKRQGSEYELSLDELSDCVTAGETPEQAIELQELSDAIAEYLRTLPEQSRDVFIHRYYYFDPVKDIAERCGYSRSKTESMLHRARKGLREYLEKEGFAL